MNETILILVLIWMSFFLGMIPILLIGRGLFGKYINAFFSGRPIIVVHLTRGGAVFRLGVPVSGGSVFAYSLWKKDDIKVVSSPKGCVVSTGKVKFIHVEEANSDPFIFEKYIYVREEGLSPVLDKDGKQKVGVDGKPEFEKTSNVKCIAFEGFNDSGIIRQLYRWALLRPSVKIGGVNIKGIIIGLVIIVIAIIIFTQLGGGSSNVIN